MARSTTNTNYQIEYLTTENVLVHQTDRMYDWETAHLVKQYMEKNDLATYSSVRIIPIECKKFDSI